MTSSDLVTDIQNNIESDGSVDYIQLYTGMDQITEITGTILGILSVIILILVPLVVVMELMYINIPTFQSLFDNGLKKLSIKGYGKTQKALEFSFRDAKKAIQMANTVKTGRSVNFVYMCLKVKWLFVLMVALAMILEGGPVIVGLVFKLIKGIIDVMMRAIG